MCSCSNWKCVLRLLCRLLISILICQYVHDNVFLRKHVWHCCGCCVSRGAQSAQVASWNFHQSASSCTAILPVALRGLMQNKLSHGQTKAVDQQMDRFDPNIHNKTRTKHQSWGSTLSLILALFHPCVSVPGISEARSAPSADEICTKSSSRFYPI